jgi:hypothetical protein
MISKAQELGEIFAFRQAWRFSSHFKRWDFAKLLETEPLEHWKDLDLELLELYTLVLMPVALVYTETGKQI